MIGIFRRFFLKDILMITLFIIISIVFGFLLSSTEQIRLSEIVCKYLQRFEDGYILTMSPAYYNYIDESDSMSTYLLRNASWRM